MKHEFSWQIFKKFKKKTLYWELSCSMQRDMTKQRVTFCNFANTLKKWWKESVKQWKFTLKQFKEELYDACGTDGRMILKWVLKQQDGEMWDIFKYLRIGMSSNNLWRW